MYLVTRARVSPLEYIQGTVYQSGQGAYTRDGEEKKEKRGEERKKRERREAKEWGEEKRRSTSKKP